MVTFIEKNKNNIDLIGKIYKSIFKNNINDASIVLLHYPLKNSRTHYFSCYNICNRFLFHEDLLFCDFNRKKLFSGITLLTGDIQFNKAITKSLKELLNDNKIAILQVPHHGSKTNWSSLCKNKIESNIYIISFGLGNKYKHPNQVVVDYLLKNNKEFFCVTQNEKFAYFII